MAQTPHHRKPASLNYEAANQAAKASTCRPGLQFVAGFSLGLALLLAGLFSGQFVLTLLLLIGAVVVSLYIFTFVPSRQAVAGGVLVSIALAVALFGYCAATIRL